MRVLATKGPEWIEGKPGEAPTVTSFVANLFGAAVTGEKNAERQFALFCGWLKQARAAVRNFRSHSPGHVLALVGPADCGKTLLQSQIITPALGGRSADPALFLTGGTHFCADLWGAEIGIAEPFTQHGPRVVQRPEGRAMARQWWRIDGPRDVHGAR